jgi:hypothetical protein
MCQKSPDVRDPRPIAVASAPGSSPAPTSHGDEAGGSGRSPRGADQRHVPLRDVRRDVPDEGARPPYLIPKPYMRPRPIHCQFLTVLRVF